EEWEKGSRKVAFFKDLSSALREADLVIEAVPEDLDLKRKIFEQMDRFAPRHSILATNSSSIPISRIETVTGRPELCLNIHFYSLAMGVNMADVMGGKYTSRETLEKAKTWLRSMGCVPLPVKKEIKGFCFNRIWRAIKREALYMWAGGFVDFRDIDRAWMIAYGTPQGPFGMMDRVGLDVVYDIEMSYYRETGDPKDHPPQALKDMVDRKKLGIKTGEGFYSYPGPEYRSPGFMRG
ncbi:MAG: 3-hydroxyacyl-CoA dehydrogenase family protein, partial [Deltaproteobacteria bacterium]|nr:3-hydroxyacyl-CoA dehydrogenase family protein [Deltaproteobacteria bacterium]